MAGAVLKFERNFRLSAAKAASALGHAARWLGRLARMAVKLVTVAILAILVGIIAINVFFHTPYNVAFRALDPLSQQCLPPEGGWSFLSAYDNDELTAIDQLQSVDGVSVRKLLTCAIQTHRVERWKFVEEGHTDSGHRSVVTLQPVKYDLAYLEFQENGDPYVLCSSAQYEANECDGAHIDLARPRGQLEVIRERLRSSEKNLVVVFVHGWRHTAQIGDGNAADLRVYAARGPLRWRSLRCRG